MMMEKKDELKDTQERQMRETLCQCDMGRLKTAEAELRSCKEDSAGGKQESGQLLESEMRHV